MDVSLIADVAWLVSIPTAALLIKFYLPGYIKEKGKNLATKEDVADITNQIEQVKVEYAKQLELYKSEIWKNQQEHLLMQEEAKLKVETFRRAVVDVARIIDLISVCQIQASNSEMEAAIAGMAHDKGNQEVQKVSWDMHLDHKHKSAKLYTDFRELIVEMGGTFALFSIYFEPVLHESLHKILMMGHDAVELKMAPAEFRKRLEDECNAGLDLNSARANVGKYYSTLYNVNLIAAEGNRFFDLMKNHIKLAAKEKSACNKT